jgi:phosphoserine aminotransferase
MAVLAEERTRVAYNFAAGPTMLPEPVRLRARDELLNWCGSGMSVWEMPFTGENFRSIVARFRDNLAALLDLPEGYRVLLMHGGASTQFSLLPLNLLPPRASADYAETGHWARKAIREGRRYGDIRIAATGTDSSFTRIPAMASWQLDPAAAYCHITDNETAEGSEFHWLPETGTVPLITDMTSSFLTRPLDVARYCMVYAGAQKNIGPAGLVLVLIRNDLLGHARPETPSVLDYTVQAENESMVNTPLTYPIYLAGLVLDWIADQGGLTAMAAAARRRSTMVYGEIDADDFYEGPVAHEDRSRVNICFRIHDRALEACFLDAADECGLANLKGHSAIGGMRASLYNAMPDTGVDALITLMRHVRRRWG